MRILHLSELLVYGGLETHILCLCKELIRHGHQPFIFAALMSSDFQRQLEDSGIEYLVDQSPGENLRNFIIENDIQLLHAHPTSTIKLSAMLGEELNKPVVVTYHGLIGWNCEVHSKIAKIICISQEIRDLLTSGDPDLINKFTVIQNGIDTNYFKPSGRQGNGRKVLFAGQLYEDKYISLKIIINALTSVPGVELKIAGYGGYFDQLKSEVPPWVECLGWVQDVPSLINQVDVFIGAGRGIREAMACGKPAIALDGRGYDGLVTPFNIKSLEYGNFMGRSGGKLDEEILLQDLRKVIDSAFIRFNLGKWGYKYAKKHYSSTVFVNKHLEIYRKALSEVT